MTRAVLSFHFTPFWRSLRPRDHCGCGEPSDNKVAPLSEIVDNVNISPPPLKALNPPRDLKNVRPKLALHGQIGGGGVKKCKFVDWGGPNEIEQLLAHTGLGEDFRKGGGKGHLWRGGGEAENYVISHVKATTHCTVCTLQYVQVCYNIYRLSSRAKSLWNTRKCQRPLPFWILASTVWAIHPNSQKLEAWQSEE